VTLIPHTPRSDIFVGDQDLFAAQVLFVQVTRGFGKLNVLHGTILLAAW
jgi:hypothetical protein